MSIRTDTQDLQINTTRINNGLFIFITKSLHFLFGQLTIRNKAIFRIYIDMIKKVFFHETVITLHSAFLYRIIFVQIEGNYIPEAEPLFTMHPDQLGI